MEEISFPGTAWQPHCMAVSVEYTRDVPLHSWISKISYNQLTSPTVSASRKTQEAFWFHLFSKH